MTRDTPFGSVPAIDGATGWPDVVAAVAGQEMVRVRAGRGDHAPLPVWMVVADGRVFARSWRAGGDGWAAVMRRDGRGTVMVGRREVAVAARPVTDAATQEAVSGAYRAKYARYAEVADMVATPSADTTLELLPLAPEETDHA